MKLSIITACFNSKETIEESIQSLISQDYKNIEHLVQDGRSTDRTLDVIKEFSPNSIIHSDKDKGLYDAVE